MRVTANQVTVARILTLPIIPVCLLGDETARLVAVVVGTLIALTDTLDGYLARKHGATVLGSLLDPVADKAFVVVCYATFAAIGRIPWWVAAAVLARELGVTVLRSSLELAGRRLPSTTIAKTKTWVQMIGFGLIVLLPIAGARGPGPLGLLFAVPLALLLAIIVPARLFAGRRWRPLWFAAASFAALWGAARWGGIGAARDLLLLVIVGITWLSAADYFGVGLRVLPSLASRRGLHALRLLGGFLLPVAALAAVRAPAPVPTVAVMVLLALEMARGAIDNFVANRGVPDFSWTLNLVAETALLVVALLVPAASLALATTAAVLAGAGLAASLIRWTALSRRSADL